MAEIQEKTPWYKKEIIRQIVSLAFEVSLVSYLFFYLVETLSASFISRFYSLNYHLILVIIFGVLTVIFTSDKGEEIAQLKTKPKIRDYAFIIILALISAGIIWFKTKELGRLSLAIAALSGLIIFSLSLLLMFDKDEDNEIDK
ncbi:MAG: hypothetical protein ABIH38_01725 [Patescibacteria group bacterium]